MTDTTTIPLTLEERLPLGEAFHSRRLTLRSSQVGRLPPERRSRWDHARRLALALELLRDPALDALLSGESAFEEMPAVMRRLAGDEADGIRIPPPSPTGARVRVQPNRP